MKRKLVTIREISKIEDIKNADNIVKATVDGWTVVIKKAEFKVGDEVLFVEIDSRSEEHTSELQSHSFISYAVFCLKKKKKKKKKKQQHKTIETTTKSIALYQYASRTTYTYNQEVYNT